MNSLMLKAICLLLVITMQSGGKTNYENIGCVYYDGRGEDVIFAPGTEENPTDLFSGFKDLMPGDSVEQNIAVMNSKKHSATVRVYMRSSGADEETRELLDHLILSVKTDTHNRLYTGVAGECEGLNDWVCLGSLKPGALVDLIVTLHVPLTVGNELQDLEGKINWEFKFEEIYDPLRPQTGDNSNLGLYIATGAACVVILGAVLVYSRKKKKNEK